MLINIKSKVIHSGIEKTVEEVHGDVLILNDRSVVSVQDVSLIEDATMDECLVAAPWEDEKDDLKRRIEEMSPDISVRNLISIVNEIDSSLIDEILKKEDCEIEAIKNKLLTKAVQIGKIQKTCPECGQIVK